ncbi:MAG: flagellar hook-length control protein FliK [Acidobacteriota bacterium]|nr:flagellar hook-length control protein FliK [Acidobacteriota bacterium]
MTPLPTPGEQAALPGQIIQGLQMQWQNGVGQATIQLNPEHLGNVSVSLQVHDGRVTAQLQASTPEVRNWIQQHAQDLQAALETQGLQLGHFAVTPTDPDGRGRQQAPPDQPPPRAPKAPPAGATPLRFEVHA